MAENLKSTLEGYERHIPSGEEKGAVKGSEQPLPPEYSQELAKKEQHYNLDREDPFDEDDEGEPGPPTDAHQFSPPGPVTSPSKSLPHPPAPQGGLLPRRACSCP